MLVSVLQAPWCGRRRARCLVLLSIASGLILVTMVVLILSVFGDRWTPGAFDLLNEDASRADGKAAYASGRFLMSRQQEAQKRRYMSLARRVVHLDLKGAPPKVSYFADLFPLIRRAGGNALLIEWEDMFPYQGRLEVASARNAYSLEEVKEILGLAAKSHLEVIPLVQTFGHLEHLLKGGEFSHLREVPQYPQSICPSLNESISVVKAMVDQVISVHGADTLQFLHIGCDEVFHLAHCSRCQGRLKRLNKERAQSQHQLTGRHLFLEHVRVLARHVRDVHGLQPLIWDDMLRGIPTSELKESGLGELVEPVVWAYGENVDAFVDGGVWQKYSYAFRHVWAASAFKGAFGERQLLPDLNRHHQNNLAWLEVMHRESRVGGHGRPINFRGVILTGWSRYDHFAVLCELLPVAIPSLVLNLVVVTSPLSEAGRAHLLNRLLKCPFHFTPTEDARRLNYDLRACPFPGQRIFSAVQGVDKLRAEFEASEASLRSHEGWLTSYNIKHNFTSNWRILEPVRRLQTLSKASEDLSRKASDALSEVYEKAIVSEWLEQNLTPLRDKTAQILASAQALTSHRTWPRRPLEDPV